MQLNHRVEDCWANPHNPNYKPNIYNARIAQPVEEGKPIPKLMRKNCKPTTEPKESTKLTSEELSAFGKDLIALCSQPEADFETSLADAAEANFGEAYQPDPMPCFMFAEAPSDTPDFQAVSRVEKEHHADLIKAHIKALSKFKEADFVAALEGEEEMDAEMEQHGGKADEKEDSEDEDEGSGSDSDDEPLAEMASKAEAPNVTDRELKRLAKLLEIRDKGVATANKGT